MRAENRLMPMNGFVEICFDSNAFHENWLARGAHFDLLELLLKAGSTKIRAYVSEVTIQEHVRHFAKEMAAQRERLTDILDKYSNGVPFVAPLIPAPPSEAKFEASFRDRLNKLGIRILPLPETAHGEMLRRDIESKRPFQISGKGYRDTLLWLGFLGVLTSRTKVAVFVSCDGDFITADKESDRAGSLHTCLSLEISKASPSAIIYACRTMQQLSEQITKPLLSELQDERKKLYEMLLKLNRNELDGFDLLAAVRGQLGDLSYIEMDGPVSLPHRGPDLAEPVHVSQFEETTDAEATNLYRVGRSFHCIGRAYAIATIEGFLDKGEAFIQSEKGLVSITDPDWNEGMAEVELSSVSVVIEFSFRFRPRHDEITHWEISEVIQDSPDH